MVVLARGNTITLHPGKIHSVAELPVPADVPLDARRVIEAQISASVERENMRSSAEAAAFQELVDNYRDELRDLLGADGYSEYRALVREEKRRRGKLLAPRGKLELSARDRQGLRQKQRKQLTVFLRSRGVSSKQLEALHARAARRVSKLVGPTPRRRADGPISPGKVPKRVLASVGNPATDPTPPYANLGFWSTGRFSGDDGDEVAIIGFDFGFSKAQGSVGNCAQVRVQEASDFDFIAETRRTLFGFWTPLPENTQSLKIWVNADLFHGQLFQSLTTEWEGTSTGSFHHDNFLFAEVIGGADAKNLNHQARTAHSIWIKGSDKDPAKLEGTFDSGPITGGGWWLLEPSLPPLVPVGNGKGLLIWVGTESTARMRVSQESGIGSAAFAWELNSIQFDPSS